MTKDLMTIVDAVDLLTQPRLIHTSITDEAGAVTSIHTEEHPSLIQLLESGTGSSNRGRSSGVRIPIDAEALEMWAQIRDQVRQWLTQLGAAWHDDLTRDLEHWYEFHLAAVLRGRVAPHREQEIDRLVIGWANKIARKYEPDEKREWTDPCPAFIDVVDEHGEATGATERCGARRVLRGGEEQFAIQVNVTQLEATCAECRTSWTGKRGLMQLRYETNLWNLDRELQAAEAAALAEEQTPARELTLTGTIDLP